MKTVTRLLGIIAIAAVVAFSMAACDTGGDGSDPNKTIIITGLAGKTGLATVNLLSSMNDEYPPISGNATISGSSVTFQLLDPSNNSNPWAGKGSFFLFLEIDNDNLYFYTDGKSLAELGIVSEADIVKLPKCNISSETTTIDFSKFLASD